MGFHGSTSGALLTNTSTPGEGAGLDLITTSTFTAAASVSVDGCFTSTYENYRIVLNWVGSTTQTVTMRMRAASTDTTGAVYDRAFYYAYYGGGGAAAVVSAGQTSISLVNATDTNQQGLGIDILRPRLAVRTLGQYDANVSDSTSLRAYATGGFQVVDAVQYDGFSLIASTGDITGVLRAYGYRNA